VDFVDRGGKKGGGEGQDLCFLPSEGEGRSVTQCRAYEEPQSVLYWFPSTGEERGRHSSLEFEKGKRKNGSVRTIVSGWECRPSY